MELSTRKDDFGASTPNFTPTHSSPEDYSLQADPWGWEDFWNKGINHFSHTNTWEDDENLYVKLPTRGVKEEDLDINVTGNTLVVTGLSSYQRENGHSLPSKTAEARIYYDIQLPKPVHHSAAKATFEDGTILITMPKMQEM